jgi:hypothetical protein
MDGAAQVGWMSTTVTNLSGFSTELRVVTWRNLFVIVDNGAAEAGDYKVLAREVKALGDRNPDGVGVLTVLPPLTTPPSQDVRVAISAGYHNVAKHLRCVSWLVEGTEFRAAAVRAALGGLLLLMRPPFPTRVTSNFDEAIPWLLGKLNTRPGQDSDPQAVIAMVKHELLAVSRPPSRFPPPMI